MGTAHWAHISLVTLFHFDNGDYPASPIQPAEGQERKKKPAQNNHGTAVGRDGTVTKKVMITAAQVATLATTSDRVAQSTSGGSRTVCGHLERSLAAVNE